MVGWALRIAGQQWRNAAPLGNEIVAYIEIHTIPYHPGPPLGIPTGKPQANLINGLMNHCSLAASVRPTVLARELHFLLSTFAMHSPTFRVLLSMVAVATTVHGWYPGQDAPGLARDTALASQAASYNFDINTGIAVQEKTSTEDATEVEFTLDNGSPYPHPYQYERIGSDGEQLISPRDCSALTVAVSKGPLLLQDTHLLELFGAFDRERIPERVVHARGGTQHAAP